MGSSKRFKKRQRSQSHQQGFLKQKPVCLDSRQRFLQTPPANASSLLSIYSQVNFAPMQHRLYSRGLKYLRASPALPFPKTSWNQVDASNPFQPPTCSLPFQQQKHWAGQRSTTALLGATCRARCHAISTGRPVAFDLVGSRWGVRAV